MLASWKGIKLFLCSFWAVLGFPFERLPDLSQPLASAAARSYQKTPAACTMDSYTISYNYIFRYSPATKLGMLTLHDLKFLLVRTLLIVCYYK